MTQRRKTNPNPNFWVRIFSAGVGVFHVKGWGPKSSVCPSKPGKSNLFGGIFRNFAEISRQHPKSLRKKCVFNFWPQMTTIQTILTFGRCAIYEQLPFRMPTKQLCDAVLQLGLRSALRVGRGGGFPDPLFKDGGSTRRIWEARGLARRRSFCQGTGPLKVPGPGGHVALGRLQTCDSWLDALGNSSEMLEAARGSADTSRIGGHNARGSSLSCDYVGHTARGRLRTC